jgi:hypothetical protein
LPDVAATAVAADAADELDELELELGVTSKLELVAAAAADSPFTADGAPESRIDACTASAVGRSSERDVVEPANTHRISHAVGFQAIKRTQTNFLVPLTIIIVVLC